jgi:hypothetical protein
MEDSELAFQHLANCWARPALALLFGWIASTQMPA